jgi:branched-subunit amino acid aminotransferase/4-amino-4-deoxychorismate lyase
MLETYGYFDGKIMKVSDARIAPHDLGILRGYGIFDFYRTYHGNPFLLKEHAGRFRRSASAIGLKAYISDAALDRVTRQLLAKNGLKDGFFRIVLTGGPSLDGIQSTSSTFYVLAYSNMSPDPKLYMTGASLMTHDHQRQYAAAKTNNYITAVRLQNERKRKGAAEILYTNDGKVLECSTSNFFIVKKGKIITAKDGILIGVTRNAVIRIAKKKYHIEERAVSISEMFSADEAFLTGTTKDILPITSIDGKKIGKGAGKGKVGPVTKDLMKIFREYIEKTCRPKK